MERESAGHRESETGRWHGRREWERAVQSRRHRERAVVQQSRTRVVTERTGQRQTEREDRDSVRRDGRGRTIRETVGHDGHGGDGVGEPKRWSRSKWSGQSKGGGRQTENGHDGRL